jgi:hypothetical protein
MPERIEVQSQRIPYVPVVREIKPAIQFPTPVVRQVPQPSLVVPNFNPPVYTPPTTPDPTPEAGVRTPPSREMDIDGVAEYTSGLSLPDWRGFDEGEVDTVEIVGLSLPVPKPEVLAIAGTTAVSSVAMALAAKSIVETLVKAMKPVVKQVVLKVKHKLGMQFSHREEQLYFSFEHKSLNKKLKAESNADLERQLLRQSK